MTSSFELPKCHPFRKMEVYFVICAVFGSACVLVLWKTRTPCDAARVTCPTTAVSPKTTPVYVVEEHHEVLLYWFDAAKKGYIKTKGNVLTLRRSKSAEITLNTCTVPDRSCFNDVFKLHIDGHSDAAPPERRDILPILRTPSLYDIYNMMQKNDVFIQAAGISGLINRYIWVRPPFNVNEPVLVDHHIANIQFGTANRTNLIGKRISDICACVKTYPEGLLSPSGWTCGMVSLDNLNDAKSPPVVIDKSRCDIKIDNALVEIVTEAKAIELLKSGSWITSLDSLILDIDEDYYGCEAAVQPLYDVKVTEAVVQNINHFVSYLFCPSQAIEELEADRLYARLIDKVVNLKRFCQQIVSASDNCQNKQLMKRLFAISTDKMIAEVTRRRMRPFLCKADSVVKNIIGRLFRYFFTFTPEQLKQLKEIGICFSMSPRTLLFDPTVGMRTCDGYNRPNDTLVPFHTPTAEEVTFRTSQLKAMLGSEGLHPGIVTVCRSMRDGYTPRKFFHKIEKDVVGVLKDVFETVDDTPVFYDPYLLGGIYGWPGRH